MKFTRAKGMCHCGCDDIVYKDTFENNTVRFFYEKLGWFQMFNDCIDCGYPFEMTWESV